MGSSDGAFFYGLFYQVTFLSGTFLSGTFLIRLFLSFLPYCIELIAKSKANAHIHKNELLL